MSDNKKDSSYQRDILINDLKKSLNERMKETSTIIENLKTNIDLSIEDEEIRNTVKETIDNSIRSLENISKITETKIQQSLKSPNLISEEE
jgi:hypothetical protein